MAKPVTKLALVANIDPTDATVPMKRKLRNYYVNPITQRKFAAQMLAVVLGSVALLNFFSLWKINQLTSLLSNAKAMDSIRTEYSAFMVWICLGAFLGVGLFSFVISLLMSHRFVGPMIAIERQLLAMAQGDFRGRLKLRKDDEMKIIAQRLNELADSLQKSTKKIR